MPLAWVFIPFQDASFLLQSRTNKISEKKENEGKQSFSTRLSCLWGLTSLGCISPPGSAYFSTNTALQWRAMGSDLAGAAAGLVLLQPSCPVQALSPIYVYWVARDLGNQGILRNKSGCTGQLLLQKDWGIQIIKLINKNNKIKGVVALCLPLSGTQCSSVPGCRSVPPLRHQSQARIFAFLGHPGFFHM